MSKEAKHQFAATRFPLNLLGSLVVMLSLASTSVAQTVPPTAPIGLTATATTCGQVNLSWDAAIDNSGTGLKAYSIWRTGKSSYLLLHSYPGYPQAESDYIQTSQNEIWARTSYTSTGGHLLVS